MILDTSNIRTGENPSYTTGDFLAIYPQFGTSLISTTVLQMYINLANTCIKEARWHDYWKIAMGWFVAHFCTLHVQTAAGQSSPASEVLAAGQARGLVASESVGDVSVSMDFSAIASDLDGWAAWKLTTFGVQLATIGKMVGKGNMYIY